MQNQGEILNHFLGRYAAYLESDFMDARAAGDVEKMREINDRLIKTAVYRIDIRMRKN